MPVKIDPDSWRTRYVVNEATGCWDWTGYKNDGGYGILSMGRGRRFRAHRYVYERLVGPIPDGQELDHLCRNRGCINPAHVEPTTHLINVQRGDAGLHNLIKDECVNGHEYTEANTIFRKDGGGRQCRACHRKSTRESQRRRRAARKG